MPPICFIFFFWFLIKETILLEECQMKRGWHASYNKENSNRHVPWFQKVVIWVDQPWTLDCLEKVVTIQSTACFCLLLFIYYTFNSHGPKFGGIFLQCRFMFHLILMTILTILRNLIIIALLPHLDIEWRSASLSFNLLSHCINVVISIFFLIGSHQLISYLFQKR